MIIKHNPFGNDISDRELELWLTQFKSDDLQFIWPLLENFRYYTSKKVSLLVVDLFRELKRMYRIEVRETFFVPVGYVAKSGDVVAYLFRRNNRLPMTSFTRIEDLEYRLSNIPSAVVFLDDFLGSGHDAIRLIDEVVRPLKKNFPNVNFIFATLVGIESGIKRARRYAHGIMDICIADLIEDVFLPFLKKSCVYPNESTQRMAESVIRKYTEDLKPRSPLGFGAAQALVSFFFGTPNNTLPIFWKNSESWESLLPYGESLRDPQSLIKFPGSLELPRITKYQEDRTSILPVDNTDYSKKYTDLLTKLFITLPCMNIADHAIRNVGMTEKTLTRIHAFVEWFRGDIIKNCSSGIALIFPKREKMEEICKFLNPRFDVNIRFNGKAIGEKISDIGMPIDGLESGFIISDDNKIKGVMPYPGNGKCRDIFVPSRYNKAALASFKIDGLILLFLKNGTIIFFDRGFRVMTYKHSQWHIHSMFNTKLLETEHGIAPGIIVKILRISVELVYENYRALFCLGDYNGVKKYINPKSPQGYFQANLDAGSNDLEKIIDVSRKEGAILIDDKGTIRNIMAILSPPAVAKDEINEVRGGIAEKMSSLTGALLIAVSKEGTITLFSKGKRIFQIMG